MIRIDAGKCVGCGLCAEDCVREILSVQDGTAVLLSEDCLDCGHCVAICPRGAVTMDGTAPGEVVPYQKESFRVDPDHFLNLIRFRRSCRNFTSDPLTDEELDHLLQAGRYTPTGSNKQTTRYILVTEGKDRLRTLVWTALERYGAENGMEEIRRRAESFLAGEMEGDRLFFGAPHVLFVVSTSMTDGCLAACSIELMAAAMGLGAMYSGYTVRGSDEAVRSFLGVASEETVCACLTLGHPVHTYRRTAPRRGLNLTRL